MNPFVTYPAVYLILGVAFLLWVYHPRHQNTFQKVVTVIIWLPVLLIGIGAAIVEIIQRRNKRSVEPSDAELREIERQMEQDVAVQDELDKDKPDMPGWDQFYKDQDKKDQGKK